MKIMKRASWLVLLLMASLLASLRADDADVKERAFDAPNNVKIKVRMEGPYAADVPLQIVGYFTPPKGAIKAQALLLIGLGPDSAGIGE